MELPRFYVRHYAPGTNPRTPAVSVIRDRWYNCSDVESYTIYRLPWTRRTWGYTSERTLANLHGLTEKRCDELNVEHEAELTA